MNDNEEPGRDLWSPYDEAESILRSCIAPYSIEQARSVAKRLQQWRDKWAAAVDCCFPDERQRIAGLEAELVDLRAYRDRTEEAMQAQLAAISTVRTILDGMAVGLKQELGQ